MKDKKAPSRPIMEGRRVPPGGFEDSPPDALAKRLDLFEVESPQRRLSDLVVQKAVRTRIESLLTKIRHQHVLYQDFGLNEIDPNGARTAINLYGPPGTGKSFAAEAIAHELGMGLIRANYAEIESKFVGETAKNIRAAFQKAAETHSVLLFDEADSILGRRLTHVRQSTDHAVNVSRSVMLLELDRFDGVTIFATNLASNYDSAFIRRILGHIEMPLPDRAALKALWAYHLPAKMPLDLGPDGLQTLVVESSGLAGGDILNIVINAASSALSRDGPSCTVTLPDFQDAIQALRQAKVEIAAGH